MKKTLTTQLYECLRNKYPEWVHGEELALYGGTIGFMTSNVSRRLRELQNVGSIERELRPMASSSRKTAWYRYKLPNNEKDLRQYYVETGKLVVEIVTMPDGTRKAVEKII